MSTLDLSPALYSQQLNEKIAHVKSLFSPFWGKEIDVFESDAEHFRMRAEFRVWHDNEKTDFIMFDEDRKPYVVTTFPIASVRVNELMQQVHKAINTQPILRHKLYQVEFLTARTGEAVITLIYHKALGDEWVAAAHALKEATHAEIIGRSKKQKLLVEKDHLFEEFTVAGTTYRYQQVEASFTQPNANVCEKMLNWAVDHSQGFEGDLLELYCGNGNFTLPLSRNFNKVVATEVSKTSVESATCNIQLNGIENIQIARMSSEEFSQAMDKVREFNRLKHINLDEYHFSTIFVDPPRAGLDPHTLEVTQRFDNIIYISCNPNTLLDNLGELTKTHEITAFALFDQFPYTHHAECGVILKKK